MARFLESEYASRYPNDPHTTFDASDAVFVEPEVLLHTFSSS